MLLDGSSISSPTWYRIERCSNHQEMPDDTLAHFDRNMPNFNYNMPKSKDSVTKCPSNVCKSYTNLATSCSTTLCYTRPKASNNLSMINNGSHKCSNPTFRSPIRSPITRHFAHQFAHQFYLLPYTLTNKSPHSSKVRSPIRSFICSKTDITWPCQLKVDLSNNKPW